MDEIIKDCLMHLLLVEKNKQSYLHKKFNKHCLACREINDLIEKLEGCNKSK